MLNFDTLTEDLRAVLGDEALIEYEVDNVQTYLDAITARRRVAPDLDEGGWLILLALYRMAKANRMQTAVQACAASAQPGGTAAAKVEHLIRSGYARHIEVAAETPQHQLTMTPKGRRAVADWLALMHLGERVPLKVTIDAIANALETVTSSQSNRGAGAL